MSLTLRPTYADSDQHYSAFSGDVSIGVIYRTPSHPDGAQWYWGLNGVHNGPVQFNGFVKTLDEAKAELRKSWEAWLTAAKLAELEPPQKRARALVDARALKEMSLCAGTTRGAVSLATTSIPDGDTLGQCVYRSAALQPSPKEEPGSVTTGPFRDAVPGLMEGEATTPWQWENAAAAPSFLCRVSDHLNGLSVGHGASAFEKRLPE